jgi:large subunit ribosomal protein L9
MTEVILKREVPRLGDRGDVVRVADGYARNYLFPKQLAIPATVSSRKNIKNMRAAAEREAARLKGDAEKLAELLQSLTIKIVARAGESNQLFGSVTSRDIAADLEKQGYKIDRHKIFLDRPIRLVGDHDVVIHLHRDIDVKLQVMVRAEGREDEVFVPQAEAARVEEPAATAEPAAEAAAAVAAAEPQKAEAEPAAETKSGKASGKSAAKAGKRAKKQPEDEE